MDKIPINSRADINIRYRHYYQELWRFYEKPVAKVSLALLLTVFSITFFASFAISPTLNTIGQLLRKIEDQKEVAEQLKKKSAALATVQNEYSLAEPNLPLLADAIPETEEIKQLLLMIEGTVADNQLSLQSLNLEDDLVYASERKSGLQEIPFALSVVASYSQLRDLLGDLSRLPRLAVIDSISFSEAEDEGSPGQLTMNIRMRAFYKSKSSDSSQRNSSANTNESARDESLESEESASSEEEFMEEAL